MQRYVTRYIDAEPLNGFVPDPRRVLLGTIVAPAVGALATEVPTFLFRDFWVIALLGLFSVVTLYLPMVLWRLRRTRWPFLTCVLIGGFSAPGLFGYFVSIGGLFDFDLGLILFPIIAAFPLGAIGGAAFWVCVVWRSEGWNSQNIASFSDV